MASIFDVAKYILDKKETMSTWKLHKLCFYCQAWHYTWTEQPLFLEEFEAWENGPVCPELYLAHKKIFMISKSDLKKGNETLLTEDEKDSVDIIIRDYGDLLPYDLREIVITEDPWKAAHEDDSCNHVITLESMGIYYGVYK